jgi:GT2 family glycosyltransferase
MISIVIVTYNSRAHVARCLDSLKGRGDEIVIVDNASSDGTAELVRSQYSSVKLISPESNLGFAAAANLGARQSTGNTILFLNPDVVCLDPLGPLETALDDNSHIAAVAGCLVNPDGRTQLGFTVRRLPTAASLLFELLLLNRLFPRNAVTRRYRCLDLDLERLQEVEQPAGACLAVRRDRFEACGGFDESFFPLWFEDVDLCKRLRDQGGTILFLPHVRVQHHGGHSLDSITFCEKQIYWYRNMLYYVRKHFPWRIGVVLRGALLAGMGLRALAELFGIRAESPNAPRRERLRAYWKAAKLSFVRMESEAADEGVVPPTLPGSNEGGWLGQK